MTQDADGQLACDLCGLVVEKDRYIIHTRQTRLHFCCDGCQGIYRMLHQPDEVPPEEVELGAEKNGTAP
ncbi:MAG: heavy metal translocating P-type ATPase metal-binding domain-containing protein [Gammaproteobacteria bacterium SHHR-1]